MLRLVCLTLLTVAIFVSPNAWAQEPSTPTTEHAWLKQFVGHWDSNNKASSGPGQPEFECKGESTAKMVGELWVVSELEADMQGAKVHAIQTIGYDPEKKKYVGTWVDSMMNHMWKYEGSVDKTGKILTLEAEGPNMTEPGKMSKYRDSYEFKSPDHIVSTSSMQDADGKWVVFMRGDMKKSK